MSHSPSCLETKLRQDFRRAQASYSHQIDSYQIDSWMLQLDSVQPKRLILVDSICSPSVHMEPMVALPIRISLSAVSKLSFLHLKLLPPARQMAAKTGISPTARKAALPCTFIITQPFVSYMIHGAHRRCLPGFCLH